ncbi:MAG: hypothetical protein KQH53_07205 [Desulfarculaceae bacterium]|nr:hypothetical protein [Desulfarculaceae bacterium]
MKLLRCAGCGQAIAPGEEYGHQGRTWCAECCLEQRMTRPRKTHWQYITAIKSQYLQEAAEKPATPKT